MLSQDEIEIARVINWLEENGEHEIAKLLEPCTLTIRYRDTFLQYEKGTYYYRDFYDVTIYAPQEVLSQINTNDRSLTLKIMRAVSQVSPPECSAGDVEWLPFGSAPSSWVTEVQGEYRQLLDALEESGFYRYVRSFNVEEIKLRTLTSGYLFNPLTFRFFPFDTEFLAEGGIVCYVNELRATLAELGVIINSLEQTVVDDGLTYYLHINGQTHIIFRKGDRVETWSEATIQTFKLVNELLEQAGADERFYLVTAKRESRLIYREDFGGIFLTDEQYDLIIECPFLDARAQITRIEDDIA